MLSIKEYTTHTLVIKKSEFICHLIPCSDIDKANDIISQYSQEDATHNCIAYIIPPYERAYDDGEPSGTAGVPMLNVLKMQGLSYIIAIVTRYFGGIKLGAGGLSRAYSQSVSECLKEAQIVEKELVNLYEITIDYTYSRKFDYLLKSHHIKCIHIAYNEQVSYQCFIKDLSFIDTIVEMTNNQVQYEIIGQEYIEKD